MALSTQSNTISKFLTQELDGVTYAATILREKSSNRKWKDQKLKNSSNHRGNFDQKKGPITFSNLCDGHRAKDWNYQNLGFKASKLWI